MKKKFVRLVVIAIVLSGMVPLLMACGLATPLPATMWNTPLIEEGTVKIPHTLEGRQGYCLLHHDVAGVPVGDVASIGQAGGITISNPERETHDGLPSVSCSSCHPPSWEVGRTTGLFEAGGEEDCDSCHDSPGAGGTM